MSLAFDAIDHDILLCRLESLFGITGNCLNWFKSYLTGRRLRVVIDGTASEIKDLKFGVPQGSVLGPKLFTMYLLPLEEIARMHNVEIHIYADDCLEGQLCLGQVPDAKSSRSHSCLDVG